MAHLRVIDTKLAIDGAISGLVSLRVLNNTIVLQKYRTIEEMVLSHNIARFSPVQDFSLHEALGSELKMRKICVPR